LRMAAKKKSGLGRGIGALIPQPDARKEQPVDVFFGESQEASTSQAPTSVAQTVIEEQTLRSVPGATLTTLSVDDIVPNRAQPRREFDEEALEELTHSIREFGVFQPVVVRAIEPTPKKGQPHYELIMGERRLRASKRAGLDTIPAIIRGTEDEHMLRDALLENLHRAELNPL